METRDIGKHCRVCKSLWIAFKNKIIDFKMSVEPRQKTKYGKYTVEGILLLTVAQS